MGSRQQLSVQLRKTWLPFFGRFGRFTPVQERSISTILGGKNVLLCAPTASGKTEAALAPLVERLHRPDTKWTLLHVCPTRALVNDIYGRLDGPTEELRIRLVRRTGDHRDSLSKIPNILVTTPESFDSLLCRGRGVQFGHVLAHVGAVVLDEIHLLHGTSRGEQLRWLLERLHLLRSYAHEERWTDSRDLQRIALSATVPDARMVADTYLGPGSEVIHVPGGREIEAVPVLPGVTDVMEAIKSYLDTVKVGEKLLVFCNSRKAVDELSARLARSLAPKSYTVFPHHGSLRKRDRELAEAEFRRLTKVVIVSTSTLEIGIDIGDIDLVVLNGPAPGVVEMLQRIGRGNRRTNKTRVMAYAGSSANHLVQSAMLAAARDEALGPAENGLHLAVARQQVASYIFQGPRRSRKRGKLEKFCGDMLPMIGPDGLLDDFIAPGDFLEDKAGVRLGQEWLDRAESGAIHSNIESRAGASVFDEKTGEELATGVTVGRPGTMTVAGRERETTVVTPGRIEVRDIRGHNVAQAEWSYASRGVPLEDSQLWAVRRHLGVPENVWPAVFVDGRYFVFHFGGSRREAVLNLAKSLARETSGEWKITRWYIAASNLELVQPSWLEDVSPLRIEEEIKSQLSKLENALGRPMANRNLAEEHRLLEVHSWLKIEHEIEAIENSEWIVLPGIEKELEGLTLIPR